MDDNRGFLSPLAHPFSRRAALGCAGLAGVGLALSSLSGAAAAQPGTPVPGGGGLGLPRADWEAAAGPGQIGQGATIYATGGEQYAVHFDNGRVANLFWIPAGQPAGLPLNDALAAAARFLPADAVLLENYDVPGAGIHAIALIQLYRSASLAGAFSSRYAASGDFVAYYETNQQMDYKVVSIDLFVGTPPGQVTHP